MVLIESAALKFFNAVKLVACVSVESGNIVAFLLAIGPALSVESAPDVLIVTCLPLFWCFSVFAAVCLLKAVQFMARVSEES